MANYTSNELGRMNNKIFSKYQLQLIAKKTPTKWTEKIEDENGNVFISVIPAYAKRFLNILTSFNYEFNILKEINSPYEIVIHAELTITGNDGIKTSRNQFGGFKYETHTDDNNVTTAVNIATAYKSALTNAFKKCCAEFGLFFDVYSQEFPKVKPVSKEEPYNESIVTKRLAGMIEVQIGNNGIIPIETLTSLVNSFFQNEEITEFRTEILKPHIDLILQQFIASSENLAEFTNWISSFKYIYTKYDAPLYEITPEVNSQLDSKYLELKQ